MSYRTFKIITIVLLIIGLIFQLYMVIEATYTAFDYRDLKGAGRAQSEFFLMAIFFIGRPIALAGLGLMIINIIADLKYKGPHIKRNWLIYLGFLILIILPYLANDILLNVMYSGWE